MKPHFEERDLKIEEHLYVLPRLEHADYMGLFSIAHHAIDTIDWNGGNSSLQALSQNCPVVTLPTEFMRGRHTVAMLNELKLPELVASDRDSYVKISSKLLKDGDFYHSIKERIKAEKYILFNDKRVPEVIMQYLDEIVYTNTIL
jgi:predicted O-linked N-acetylglucosamine transferase (SPINDLY family)